MKNETTITEATHQAKRHDSWKVSRKHPANQTFVQRHTSSRIIDLCHAIQRGFVKP